MLDTKQHLEVQFFMTKYSEEVKQKAVRKVLESHMSAGSVAKSIGTAKSVVQRWVARYEQFGTAGLCKKSQTYSGAYKLHVIKYMYENHLSYFSTAAHFVIGTESTVGKWERIYYEEGIEALYRDNRGRPKKMKDKKPRKPKLDKQTEEDLIAEIQQLRMENEYLKKLNALVQEREKSAKKTK